MNEQERVGEQRLKFEKSYAEWESDQDERSPVSHRNAYAAGYEAAWVEREAAWRAAVAEFEPWWKTWDNGTMLACEKASSWHAWQAACTAVSGISDTAELEKLAAVLIKAIMHCSTTPLMIRRMVPILRAARAAGAELAVKAQEDYEILRAGYQSELAEREAAWQAKEIKLKAIIRWLEANQPDVFRRGLWEAIDGSGPQPIPEVIDPDAREKVLAKLQRCEDDGNKAMRRAAQPIPEVKP
jgi:hypothetical protein